MKKIICNLFLVLLCAATVAGCSKAIPSCGDEEATNEVSKLLTDSAIKDMDPMMTQVIDALEEKSKTKVPRIHFSVDQPVVLAHDDKINRYSCKALATYQVSDATIEKMKHNPIISILSLIMDKNTKKISVEVQYTISKIDGSNKQFLVEAKWNHGLTTGVQALEMLQSIALFEDKLPTEKSVASPAIPQSSTSEDKTAALPLVVPIQSIQSPTIELPQPPAQKPETKIQDSVTLVTPKTEASFDCTKASLKIEKLICSTPETAESDKKLSIAYNAARSKSSDQVKLKYEQLIWMKQIRNICDDSSCLLLATQDRIHVLQNK